MKQELLEALTQDIYTREQAIKRIVEASTVSESIYKGKEGSLSQKIKSRVTEPFLKLVSDLEKAKSFPSGQKEQEKIFKELAEYLDKMTACKITLAFNPSQEFIQKIAGIFEKATGQKVIMDVYVNEEIVAGAIFEYNGEYRDFSLSNQIEKMLETTSLEKKELPSKKEG